MRGHPVPGARPPPSDIHHPGPPADPVRRRATIPTDPMDVTAASIGLSRGEFLVNLNASRLLAPEELDRFAADHPDDDALGLAQSLRANGTLTEYQLDAIAQGRSGEVRIGNYDILDRIGAGGMGTVFKARHRRMKRV